MSLTGNCAFSEHAYCQSPLGTLFWRKVGTSDPTPLSACQPQPMAARAHISDDLITATPPRPHPTYRTVCDPCAHSKVRCSGSLPCARCIKLDLSCRYSIRKRPTRQRRVGTSEPQDGLGTDSDCRQEDFAASSVRWDDWDAL